MKKYYKNFRNRFLHGYAAKKVKIIMLCVFTIVTTSSSFSPTSTLKGRIFDKETKEPLAFANIVIELDSMLQGGTQSDFDGNYTIKPIPPGTYDIRATYVGYKTVLITGVTINPDVIRFLDIEMESTAESLEEIVVTSYHIPLIDKDYTVSGRTVSKMPGRSSSSISTTIGGVFSTDGERASVRGSRSEGTVMYIDGIRVLGSSSIADGEGRYELSEAHTTKTETESIVQNRMERFQAGLLTAGEVNDFSKWELWKDISNDELKEYQNIWNIYPENRYCVQVSNNQKFPMVGCKVELIDESAGVIWTTITDNTGKAELWSGLFGANSKKEKKFSIQISYGSITERIKKPKTFKKGINSCSLDIDCESRKNLDILFTVDATGSMGDEINYLKVELNDIISKFSTSHPDLNVRLGSVFYRDLGDEYITRKSDFSSNIKQTVDFIEAQNAGGGGDSPEAVDEAMECSVNELSWSDNARAKLMFLILDAPPHNSQSNIKKLNKAIEIAAKKGIKIIPITASGINKSAEYLMRSIALATNGTYVFLTDDSGIGGKHIKPSIDDYKVELLNDLILRLLAQYTFVEDCNTLADPEKEKNFADVEVLGLDEENQPEELVEEDDTSADKVVDVPKAPKKAKEKVWIKPYPNPTTGLVNIKHSKKVKEIYVVDMAGKILQRLENNQNDLIKVNLGDFPNGMYFLKYANDNQWEYAKIILKH